MATGEGFPRDHRGVGGSHGDRRRAPRCVRELGPIGHRGALRPHTGAGLWGEEWADGHIAPRGAGGTPSAWSASLLGAEEIHETILASGPYGPGFLGVKVTATPAETSVQERLVVADRALGMVSRVADQVRGNTRP